MGLVLGLRPLVPSLRVSGSAWSVSMSASACVGRECEQLGLMCSTMCRTRGWYDWSKFSASSASSRSSSSLCEVPHLFAASTHLGAPPIQTFRCSPLLRLRQREGQRSSYIKTSSHLGVLIPCDSGVCQGCAGLLHLLLGLVPLQDHATALLRGRHDPPLRLLLLARQGCHFSDFESCFLVWA